MKLTFITDGFFEDAYAKYLEALDESERSFGDRFSVDAMTFAHWLQSVGQHVFWQHAWLIASESDRDIYPAN